MIGAPIRFKMSALGEPTDIRVPEQVTKALSELGPAAAGAGAMFSEEGLKEQITQSGLILPRDELAPGGTWTRQTRNVVPPLGTVVIASTYRYDGPDQAAGTGPGAIKISLDSKVEIQPDAAEPNPGGLKIRTQKASGSYLFDNAAGHIVGSSIHDTLEVGSKISIKTGAGGLSRDMELTQSTDTTTTRRLTRVDPPK